MTGTFIRLNRGAALLAVAFAALALAGCGGSDPGPQVPEVTTEPPPAEPSSPVESSPPVGDAKPADTKPADTKPADTKPADSSPADAKPADAVTTATPPASPRDKATTATSAELEGKLVSRSGALLVIDAAGASPSPGAKGILYRHFEQEIGPLRTSGWLAIADVTVKDAKGSKIRLDMVAEKSIIMLNGKKVNHFESGNKIKLELTK